MKSLHEIAHASALSFFDWVGLDVAFARPIRNPVTLLSVKAAELGVGTVLDIGANIGQFGKQLRKAGYKGRIVSCEPLRVAHAALSDAAAGDPNWQVLPRMALGDANGTATINISHNLASSSLLAVEDRSVTAAPVSGFAGSEEVDVRRLDDVAATEWRAPFAMKFDTQGFELHVLRGAPETMKKAVLVVAEMSLVPLYVGGASFIDVYRTFEESGFRCISLVQGFADHHRDELLQVDGVFTRI